MPEKPPEAVARKTCRSRQAFWQERLNLFHRRLRDKIKPHSTCSLAVVYHFLMAIRLRQITRLYRKKTNPPHGSERRAVPMAIDARGLFLPSTLFVAVRLQALSALVLVHFQAAFFLQIAHGDVSQRHQPCACFPRCKAQSPTLLHFAAAVANTRSSREQPGKNSRTHAP